MGTCIIDKIGSLKRNKGEVSFLAPSFLGDVTCTYGHVCPIKLSFCFFFFVVQEWVHTILPTLPIILRVPHLLLHVLKEMKGP